MSEILKSSPVTVRASAALAASWNLGTPARVGSEVLVTLAVVYTRLAPSVTGRVRLRAMGSIDDGVTYHPLTRRIGAPLTGADARSRIVDVQDERPTSVAADEFTWVLRVSGVTHVRVDFYDIDQAVRGTLAATASISTATMAGEELASPDVVATGAVTANQGAAGVAQWPVDAGQGDEGPVPPVVGAGILGWLASLYAMLVAAVASILAAIGLTARAATQTDGTQQAQIVPGAVGLGNAARPVRTDPTGTTAQTVTAVGGGALATEATLGTEGAVPPAHTGTGLLGYLRTLLDAWVTNGTARAIARGGEKGLTAAADATATSIDAGHTALDVAGYRIGDATNAITVQTANADGEANATNRIPVIAWLKGINLAGTWDALKTGLTAVSGVLTGLLNTLPWSVYKLVPTVRANNEGGPLLSDADGMLRAREAYVPQYEDNVNGVAASQNKPLAASTYAWSVDRSTALEASTVSKATPGVLRFVSMRLDKTAPSGRYYLQVLNAAALPADGAVTTLCAPTAIDHVSGYDDAINLDFTMNGIYASAGIVICLSDVEFTKHIAGAYLSGTVLFI